MSFWGVVFIVLMLIWLFGGAYGNYTGGVFNPVGYGTSTVLPWCCVAILGYIILAGGGAVMVIR